ncbi:MAG: amidohydrolase family protein, partial [bacterium]|nr:amidohydrolase family protein [bacterium]
CCGEEGVRWIGELVGYITGYGEEYATPEALQIMRTVASYGAAVNIHCGDLGVVEDLCRAVPGVNFVLAHPGAGKDEFLNRLAKVAELPNLHLDISGSGIDRFGIIRRAVDTAGKEKILFGTDYPINNPAVYVHGVFLEELTEEELCAVYRDNFLRLAGQ